MTALFNEGKMLIKNWKKISIFPVLFLLIVFAAINGSITNNFFTVSYMKSFFSSNLPLILLTIGVAMVIIGGGIDISLGSLATVINALCIILVVDFECNVFLAMPIVLLISVLCGIINGCVISMINVPPLLATFALTSIYDGIALWIMPKPRSGIPYGFVSWYNDAAGLVPNSIWILLGAVVIWLVITKLPLKLQLYSLGYNRLNSYASGVPVIRTQIFTYAFAGFMAGLAGICISFSIGSADPLIGQPMSMQSVAACAIGGISLDGGKGGIVGAVLGSIFLSMVTVTVFALKISSFDQDIVEGTIILAGVIGSVLINRAISRKKV